MRTTTIAAMPNAHSHAFQRDLRGLGERNLDDFWSWRTQMLHLAQALDPESMQRVAAQVYREMLAAGYGAVGEFHYVHHAADGSPYDEPNALALAVAQAALDVGLRIVVIPAAYHGGGHPRFHDRDVESFLARVDALREWADGRDGVSVAVAAHSVRAVPPAWLQAIAGYAGDHGLPRHVHASEQPREVSECRAQHGASPIELLARTGYLGPRTTVVHAIHVDERDVALLADSDTIVVTCPTTEGNLGDGHLPALAYRDAGVRLAIGSDSQVRVDPFEETRELETGARREGTTRRALLAHTATCGRSSCATGWPASAWRAARPSTSTSITPTCAASRGTRWRSRWPRARPPAWSAVRPAARAPAAAACRSGRPAPPRAGR
jgi:formimidoylglutamate deiminase